MASRISLDASSSTRAAAIDEDVPDRVGRRRPRSRASAGPVCMTRLAMRPAKSFWKKVQLWRTTCQWLCQRIRLVRPGIDRLIGDQVLEGDARPGARRAARRPCRAAAAKRRASSVAGRVARDQRHDAADEDRNGRVEQRHQRARRRTARPRGARLPAHNASRTLPAPPAAAPRPAARWARAVLRRNGTWCYSRAPADPLRAFFCVELGIDPGAAAGRLRPIRPIRPLAVSAPLASGRGNAAGSIRRWRPGSPAPSRAAWCQTGSWSANS